MKVTAVLLAAGQGTRMKSDLPKMLHPLCGKPMLFHSLAAVRGASSEPPVVIVGAEADPIRRSVSGDVRFAVQDRQLGTGHALLQAESLLKGRTDYVLVTYGDMPLLQASTLAHLIETQKSSRGPLTMLTVLADDPRGFGRVLRNADGTVAAIVEESAATAEQLQVRELNVGAYCFKADWLWDALHRIKVSPQGEYYLTDTAGLAAGEGLPIQAVVCADPLETIGINTRVHLAEAEAVMRARINREHMLNGVTIMNPDTTYIETDVRIGKDTLILPNTYVLGGTVIGARNRIGPNSHIRDSQIGNDCQILMSVVEGAVIEDHVDIGPFARLRTGAHLGQHVHMGNFGEVKDSHLGAGVKMGHFSYIGNATIGPNTNIGAGTITCNFDGLNKNPTEIGEDVFLGSDSMLVAPLKIGDRARTGAGAVVTKDVPPDMLAVGMPARAIKKLDTRTPKAKDKK
ncbi:MAG TPA: bifunctional UDP-N-acetylglucosamine diphosphorylase/glucosamine-1-phosphate N-acetyltransferase GlmU [Anaerolineales bacterium]|nr:bifunctional UDP-N-acetylglucosamine diphosphorylase/glucosamine-1-phosphate N-acetyltransferase GlmU [Anaerolineales bacterium]